MTNFLMHNLNPTGLSLANNHGLQKIPVPTFHMMSENWQQDQNVQQLRTLEQQIKSSEKLKIENMQ